MKKKEFRTVYLQKVLEYFKDSISETNKYRIE